MDYWATAVFKKHYQILFVQVYNGEVIFFKSPYALLIQSENNSWFYIHIYFLHLNRKGESVNSN